jgi:hypothetical protein
MADEAELALDAEAEAEAEAESDVAFGGIADAGADIALAIVVCVGMI